MAAGTTMTTEEETGFQSENNSKLEPLLIEKVCKPILGIIPESVHPNTISLANHVVCWGIAICAYLATVLGPLGRSLALLGGGLCMFGMAVGDCLDGMQARRTNKCSKLGEMMDHWLDGVHVPMATFGVTLALQMEPWAAAAVHITSSMIFNAQLVLYHKTGRYVHGETSGTDAQLMGAGAYFFFAVFFYFVDRHTLWVDVVVTIAAAVAVFTQMKCNIFYYVRLKKHVVWHLPFVALSGGFTALYLLGMIGTITFLLSIVLLSFRITGSYVLYTIIGRPYHGMEIGVALLIGAIAAGHQGLLPISFQGHALHTYLPAVTCAYMVVRNLIDFAHHFSELRPEPQPAGDPG